jgi:hypothetical protein
MKISRFGILLIAANMKINGHQASNNGKYNLSAWRNSPK